jgi:hypothetical protein
LVNFSKLKLKKLNILRASNQVKPLGGLAREGSGWLPHDLNPALMADDQRGVNTAKNW